MKRKTIPGIGAAFILLVFMFASTASAQSQWDILNGQWFKSTLSLSGYMVESDGETILGKGAGSTTVYLQTISQTNEYTITTCTKDENSPGNWQKRAIQEPIGIAGIHGATYPELWDFAGNALVFYDGVTDIYLYPTLYIKVTTTRDGVFKKANISTVACGAYTSEAVTGQTGFGSCKLTGSTVLAEKVPLPCR